MRPGHGDCVTGLENQFLTTYAIGGLRVNVIVIAAAGGENKAAAVRRP